MAAGEQVALEPALAGVLGEDLHHPTLRREVLVDVADLGLPHLVRRLVHGAEPVGVGLVGADQAEVAARLVGAHDVAQPGAEHRVGSDIGVPGVSTATA